jgi:prevent-host-death family protein
MHWHVAEAKQKFSEVLRATSEEPQLIFNRDRLVAAVVDARTFHAFQAWYEQQGKATLAEAFAELRCLCAEEDYTLTVPPRRDRDNAFVEVIANVSV